MPATTFAATSWSGACARTGKSADCTGRVSVMQPVATAASAYTSATGASASIETAVPAKAIDWTTYPASSARSRRTSSPITDAIGATIAAGSASSAGDPSNDLGFPEDSTLFYPVLLYQQGFRFFNMGYAAAMAVLLLVVSFAITMIIIRNSRRWVHYAGAGR